MKLFRSLLLAAVLPFLASTPTFAQQAPLSMPTQLQGKAEVVGSTDADFAKADSPSAIKPEGQGGISQGLVVRLTADVPVYRMWSGPTKKDSRGNTNRLGQWWSYDAPNGTQAGYRTDYEICMGWNDLTWVATCTLKKGAVVVVGPGQSVSAATCGDATGKESYPANSTDWQVYVSKAWARMPGELECPPEAADYEADLNDISKKKAAAEPAK